jgi:PAS domain S-box-containing protein
MNSQPNQSEHVPEPTARRSETERCGIINSIPAPADQSMKLPTQPDDYDQRADLHSLNSMIGVPMEIGRFLTLAVAITAALKQVHQGGLIHKDIKPDNILVSETGEVQLTGFDIASRLPRERQLPAPPEFIAGTLAYMAPEQTGRMNRSIDARSDLYALGVTLYEMITGSLPFTASDPMEWVHCHIARQAVPPHERSQNVPVQVSAIIMKLLAKIPEERYQTAAGLESDLRSCLAAWETRREIDDFPLGEHDRPDRLLIPEKLYGREREVGTLLAAFDRVVKSGTPELVLVSGYSGIGKSSVVNELHKVLVPPRGLFASGKFDQYKRDIPYATLVQAFQSLLRPLLTKSETELSKWRDALCQALDPNGQLIVDLVPELKLIIGDQPAVQELPPQDARRRFHMIFRRFISVFARPEHPLTLFLDDLQWLDPATLNLIADVLSEPDVTHLLLIGAYRDNEVDPSHPLMRKLQEIRQTGRFVYDIVLAPLAREDLEQLIVDTLRCKPDRTKPLAQLVEDKTAGNPFFAIRFILSLAEEGLLAFDHGEGQWLWDLNRICGKGYTDNVVELMVGKLRRLRQETQSALQHLACLGHTADIAMLAQLSGTSEEQVHADLWEAVRLELVERAAGSYRFVHDRIQEAAYSLISEESRAASHLGIGRFLATHTPPEKREEAIFDIVNQFNRASALITSPDEREQVAELNLIAGKRAKASTAYASSLKYLRAGRTLLTEETWNHNYDLVFSVECLLAECELLIADMAAAENRLSMLAERAKSAHDIALVTRLRLTLYAALDRSDRAVEVFLEFWRGRGTNWSPHPTEEEVLREYEHIWSLLGTRQVEELVDLPLISNPDVLDALDVLSEVVTPALFVDAGFHDLVVCRMVSLSLEHGNSDGSCYAYVWLGMLAGPHFGNYQAGFRFGKLGCDLAERRGLNRYQARTYMCFASLIVPWTKHVKTGRELLRRCLDAANRIGDLIYAVYSWQVLITNLLASGDSLAQVQREAEIGLEFTTNVRFGAVIDAIAGQLWFIRTLRGLTAKFGVFNDDRVDELRFERHLQSDPGIDLAACWYWVRKLQARFLAGDYPSAIQASLNAGRLLRNAPFVFEVAEYHFYSALARAAAYGSATDDARQRHLEALAAHQKQQQIWAHHCPENFENRAALVGAEIARIEGHLLDAEQLYEKAIRSAHTNGFVHNEALANEVAGRFYAERGFEKIARAYLQDAKRCYLRWGADGKVRQLEQLHPYLREAEPVPGPMKTMGAPVEHLDLATVIKVSQAISSEIVLEKLIDALMRTALQQAGADRGALLLLQLGGLRIAAEATTDGSEMVVSLDNQPAANADLPQSVLQYVQRTQENIILDDATVQNPYTTDSYIRQCHPRSVLCLPLLNQGKLIGILYLENKLAPRVFVPARMAVLRLLASQAAISLENSRLYRDLAQREAKIRRLVEGEIIGVFIWDLDGRIFEANDTFLRMVGYSREDLGRLNWRDLTPPEWHEADERFVQEHRKTGRLAPIEKEYFRKDGSRLPILLGAASFDEDQSQGVAFVLDLTERKQAEEALRRTERELRDLVENMPAMAGVLLPDGSHPYLTNQWREYTGLSVAETDSEGWRRAVHPEDIDSHVEKFRAAAAARKTFENEVRLRRVIDGEYRWFLVRIAPLSDERGNIVKWHGVLTDIEDRKRAEQALKRSEAYLAEAQELTRTGSWAWDPHSDRMVYCSDEIYRIFGLDPAEGMPSIETFIQRIHPDDRAMVRAQSLQGSREEPEHAFEYRILSAEGAVQHVRSLRRTVLNDSGEVVEVVGTTMDITERRLAEQERDKLHKLEAELTHMDRVSTMGEMAASLAHEVKQPIAAAVMNAEVCLELLQRDQADIPELTDATSAMLRSAKRAADIIDSVRSLTRRGTPKREVVVVNDVIREIDALLQNQARQYSVGVHLQLKENVPCIVGDRVQLQQVVMNLMLNAIEAMNDAGGELVVKSELTDAGDVLISVSDTGTGLPKENEGQIFEAFFTTKSQGSGMGLAISRSIVDSHGGRLWATGNPDRGATFYFQLPRQVAAPA